VAVLGRGLAARTMPTRPQASEESSSSSSSSGGGGGSRSPPVLLRPTPRAHLGTAFFPPLIAIATCRSVRRAAAAAALRTAAGRRAHPLRAVRGAALDHPRASYLAGRSERIEPTASASASGSALFTRPIGRLRRLPDGLGFAAGLPRRAAGLFDPEKTSQTICAVVRVKAVGAFVGERAEEARTAYSDMQAPSMQRQQASGV